VSGRLPWDPFPSKEPDPRGPDAIHAICYRGAVAGADAYRFLRIALRRDGGVLRVGNRFVPDGRYREVAFLAVGHASGSMSLAVLDAFGDRLTQGFVAGPEEPPTAVPFRSAELPPGWGGAAAAPSVVEAGREIAEGLKESDLFLVLLSPGAIRGLLLPPTGMLPEEFSRLLQDAHALGASGPEVMLLARVLGTGGVGGRLLPPSTAADVEVLIVDRGDGPTLLGGGPFAPVMASERTEARAVLGRLGLVDRLPATALEAVRPGGGAGGAGLARVHASVLVAGPPDGLRGAADAAFDRGWTARLASLEMREAPEGAADRLLGQSEALLRDARPGPAGGTKGYATFAMATLDLPEGVDDTPYCRAFLERARAGLRRREMSVGLFRTSGPLGPHAVPDRPGEPGGWVVGAPSDPEASPVPAAMPRPLAMRAGITDVGLLAMTVWRPPGTGGRPSS
jgi:hypothetical protein